MNAVVVRATPESVPQLVASAIALFAEDGGQRDPHLDLTWPRREGSAYFADLLRRDDSLCLLALSGTGSALGHLIGRLRRPGPLRPGAVVGVLESLRVDPAHRETGVATALTEEFFTWARNPARISSASRPMRPTSPPSVSIAGAGSPRSN